MIDVMPRCGAGNVGRVSTKAPDEAMLDTGEVTAYEWPEGPHTLAAFLCHDCDEMVVARNARP